MRALKVMHSAHQSGNAFTSTPVDIKRYYRRNAALESVIVDVGPVQLAFIENGYQGRGSRDGSAHNCARRARCAAVHHTHVFNKINYKVDDQHRCRKLGESLEQINRRIVMRI